MRELFGGLRAGDSLGNRMALFFGDHVLYVGAVELGGNNSKDYNLYYCDWTNILPGYIRCAFYCSKGRMDIHGSTSIRSESIILLRKPAIFEPALRRPKSPYIFPTCSIMLKLSFSFMLVYVTLTVSCTIHKLRMIDNSEFS